MRTAILVFTALLLSPDPPRETTVVAGGAAAGSGSPTCCGDGGEPTSATLSGPEGLVFDSRGRLYIADRWNNRIRVVDERLARIETLAGGGDLIRIVDGVDARAVRLGVQLLAVDPSDNVFFADNEGPTVYRLDAKTRTISLYAGALHVGQRRGDEFGGDGGPARSAALTVNGIACDRAGDLYLTGVNRVRRVSAKTGLIETIAGTGRNGFFGDGGPAKSADLGNPTAIAIDAQGTIYFSEPVNNRIRAIDRKGTIRTVAGNGRSGPFAEGDALRSAIGDIVALAIDRLGDVVFMHESKRIRRLVVAEHRVETILDRGVFDLNRTREAPGLAVSAEGTILFALPQQNRVESIVPPGVRRRP